MAGNTENGGGQRRSPWRTAAWGAAALVLLIPLVTMQLTDEVNWTVADFVFAGILILGVGIPFELAVRKTGNTAYRWAVGVALAAAFLLIWVNGAVGIIGAEDNGVNLLYYVVLLIAFVGTLFSHFRPRGMGYAMTAAAVAQAAVAVGAMVAGLAATIQGGAFEIVAVNGFFVALWAGSAALFREAAHGEAEQGAV